jgi:hypothetical protein
MQESLANEENYGGPAQYSNTSSISAKEKELKDIYEEER